MRILAFLVALLFAVPAWATCPAIQTTSAGNTADSTSHAVTLPSGISAGDLIVIGFAMNNAGSVTWGTFTELFDDPGTGTGVGIAFAYKRAAGGETSETVTTSASDTAAFVSYRISGIHASSNPEAGTVVNDSSGATEPNSPSLTPSWGAEDTLWLSFITKNDDSDPISYPTNYSSGQIEDSTTGVSAAAAMSAQCLNAASENPGAYNYGGGGDSWNSNTIAIRPAAVAATRKIIPIIIIE